MVNNRYNEMFAILRSKENSAKSSYEGLNKNRTEKSRKQKPSLKIVRHKANGTYIVIISILLASTKLL